VRTDGSYNITKDIVFSFPVTHAGDGSYNIVKEIKINEYY